MSNTAFRAAVFTKQGGAAPIKPDGTPANNSGSTILAKSVNKSGSTIPTKSGVTPVNKLGGAILAKSGAILVKPGIISAKPGGVITRPTEPIAMPIASAKPIVPAKSGIADNGAARNIEAKSQASLDNIKRLAVHRRNGFFAKSKDGRSHAVGRLIFHAYAYLTSRHESEAQKILAPLVDIVLHNALELRMKLLNDIIDSKETLDVMRGKNAIYIAHTLDEVAGFAAIYAVAATYAKTRDRLRGEIIQLRQTAMSVAGGGGADWQAVGRFGSEKQK